MDVLQLFLAAPSVEEWWRFAGVLAGLTTLVAVGEIVRGVFRWSPEFTRKLVHVSVGILIVFAPLIFIVPLPAILLALLFIIVNFLAVRFGLLKGMHDSSRRSYGTVYYPLAFLILVMVFWYRSPLILSCSILVLAFGDAAAAIVGELVPSPKVFHLSSDKKSIQGSIAMGLVSFAVLVAGMFLLGDGIPADVMLASAGVAAVTATAWEALSSRGLDNLTVPLSVAVILSYYLLPAGHGEQSQLTLGTIFAILVAAVSYRMKFLSASGSMATFLLAVVVFGFGGWRWTVPILTFFVTGSALSHIGKDRKAHLEGFHEKGGTRDYAQVFANGGIAGLVVIASSCIPGEWWYLLYLGSLCAVAADTWSTEIGIMSRGKTVMITTFGRVESGRSGGVSWQGLAGGLAGSLVVATSAWAWIESGQVVLLLAAAGLAGTLADSLLGATVQAEYRCPVCNAMTERPIHCTQQPTILVRGERWITNDAVNWMCAGVGLLFMALAV